MVSEARSVLDYVVNKALVLSVRRHHARVTHQIMLLVLSSAGARGAKGSNELNAIEFPLKSFALVLEGLHQMVYA